MTPAVRLAAAEVRVGGRTILGPSTSGSGPASAGRSWVRTGRQDDAALARGRLAPAVAGTVEVLGERLGRTDVRGSGGGSAT